MRSRPGALHGRDPAVPTVTLVALASAVFCFVTGENLPIGLLAVISRNEHVSLAAVGLLVTAYALTVVVASVPLAHATRRVPRRHLLSGLLAAYAIFTLAAAFSPGYWWLLAARLATALTQALFWAVTPPAVSGLFPPERRSRSVARVMVGASLAFVLGVPAATWLGERAGWRAPFFALCALSLVALVLVARLVPLGRPAEGQPATGPEPDRRQYAVLIATTMLAIAGVLTASTYVTAFVTDVSHLSFGDVPAVLLAGGLASAIGVLAVGQLLDRWSRGTTAVTIGIMGCAALLLYPFGTSAPVAVVLESLTSLGLGTAAISLQTRVLVVAPRSSDLAAAGFSAAFNVGIAAGPAIGGLVLRTLGLRDTPLVGGLLVLVALALFAAAGGARGPASGPVDHAAGAMLVPAARRLRGAPPRSLPASPAGTATTAAGNRSALGPASRRRRGRDGVRLPAPGGRAGVGQPPGGTSD